MKIESNKKYLFIVESPEKAQKISKIFSKLNYKNIYVMATIGHFTKIKDGSGYFNTGIHPENNFKIDWTIDEKRKGNVEKLKKKVKESDFIFVATDLDREGEAIAWSCLKFLGIPKDKYIRVRYNAVDAPSILSAMAKDEKLDMNLVKAAHARACLDKIFGYVLSYIVRKELKAKGAGRVQSPTLGFTTELENKILSFIPEKFIDLYLHFKKNDNEFKAKYQGTDSESVKRIADDALVEKVVKDCKNGSFIVKHITSEDKKENPKAPFSTASFQQECSSKLNLSVKTCQDTAQLLFSNGYISYHRTDDEEFAPEFEKELKDFVLSKYGKEYASGFVTKGKKDENAQEAHEGLHVLDLNLTPEKFALESPSELATKVYRIIYNRTVACALKPAIIAQTTYDIYNGEHKFTMISKELKFDGYRCVYNYKDEDSKEDDDIVRETFKENEVLTKCSLEAVDKETQPPSRYKEATLVKEMKVKGIGRPSTYSSTIERLEDADRNYLTVEKHYLKPTEQGMKLMNFLNTNFGDIVNVEYTKIMEENLDKVARDALEYIEYLQSALNDIEKAVDKYKEVHNIATTTEMKCPNCGKPMILRKGKFGEFYGCSGYPKCKTIINKWGIINDCTKS